MEDEARVDIVDEGQEKTPFRLFLFAPDKQETPERTLEESTLTSIPAGRQKLFVAPTKPNTLFLEVSYEVLDREGKVQWHSGKTHVPAILDIPAGGTLRIRRFPPIPLIPQNDRGVLKSPRAPEPAEENARCQVEITREREKEPYFGLTVTCRREDGREFILSDEGEGQTRAREGLPPGRYDVRIRHSRSGFPQFGIVRVLDAQGKDVETYPPTYEPLYNPQIILRAGEKLMINALPPVRSYNANFFTIGEGAERVQSALVIPRPYPAQDFETHRGTEQFNALPLSIAFSGRKAEVEQPEDVARIQREGAPGLPNSSFASENPAWALGCGEVARRLAKKFVQDRGEETEDIRGPDHLSFLMKRTSEGKTPNILRTISEEELAGILWARLVEMEEHHVHRINEGGGYHNKSFRQDLEEADGKMRQWPLVCFQATEADVKAYRTSTKPEEQKGLAGRALYAVDRELMNCANYPSPWLEDVRKLCPGESISHRKEQLQELRKTLEEAMKP